MPRAQRRAFQSSNKKKMPAPFGTGTSLFKNERLSEEVQLLDLDLSASLGQLLLDVLSLSLGDLLLDSLGSAIDDKIGRAHV